MRETDKGRGLILLFYWEELHENKYTVPSLFLSNNLQGKKEKKKKPCKTHNFLIQFNTPYSF